jgi:hypothetical protein
VGALQRPRWLVSAVYNVMRELTQCCKSQSYFDEDGRSLCSTVGTARMNSGGASQVCAIPDAAVYGGNSVLAFTVDYTSTTGDLQD